MLGSAPWDTISVFASFFSCFHNDFDGVRSLVSFVAVGARLSWLSHLTALSGLVWGFWWSALTHVLRFYVLFRILLCCLPSILRLQFPFLFFLLYCVTYRVFLFSSIDFFLICTIRSRVRVPMGPSGTRHMGSCWPVFLALISTLSFYGLVPRRLVISFFHNNSHSVAWPCLSPSFLGSSGFPAPTLIVTAGLPFVCLGSVPAVSYICLPPYLD